MLVGIFDVGRVFSGLCVWKWCPRFCLVATSVPLPLQDACIVYVCNERGALWYGEKRAPDDGCGGNVDGVVEARRVASHGKPGCVVCPHEAGGTRPRLGIGQCIVDRIAVGVKQAEVDDSGLLLLLLLLLLLPPSSSSS